MAKKPTYEELEQRVKELQRKQAEEAPAKLNLELERRIEDRTAELAKTNEQLIETKTLLDNVLLYSGGDAVMATDMDMRILLYNQRAKEIFGYGKEEVIGKSVWEMHLKEKVEPERLERAIQTVREKSVYEYDIHGEDPEGNDRWFHSVITPLRNEKGEQLGYVLNSRDVTRSRRAEEELRESEEKFRALVENQHDVVWAVNENLEVDYISPSCFRMTGTTAEETRGMNPKDFYTEESYQRILMKLAEERQKVANEIQPAVLEVDQYHKDGHLFPVEITCMPIIIDNKFIGVQGISRDITERKNAEEEIRKLSTAVEQSPSVIAITDLNGNLEYVNPKFTELTGYTSEEAMSKNPRILKSGGLPDEIYKELWGTVSSGKIWRGEFHNKKKDGELFWEAASVSPIFDKQGKITNYIRIAEDISERKKAEEALRESEEKYRITFESIPDSITITSIEDGRYFYVNDGFCHMTSYSVEEAVGKTPFDLNLFVNSSDRDELISTLKKEGEVNGVELQYRMKDGTVFDTLFSARPLLYGKKDCLVAIVKDITSIKRTEQEKFELQVQLQQVQKMEAIGTLAGGIAHDFNNILGGIIGYSELAKMKAPEGSNIIAYLDKGMEACNRAAELIKQILTLSRQHKQEQRPVQVRYIVKEALNLLRATLPTTIEIREDLSKDTGVVNADPTQMHQVIMNLGTNAGHAMQEDGGALEVSLANVELDDLSASKHLDLAAGSYIRLMVSDTGHGMTSEIMDRIFDPYFTTKDTGEGTGLGLSVVQGIVKAHGGTITVYSKPGKGTTFHVYLPIIHEAEKPEKESEEPLPTGSERILFIDDEEVLVEIASQMLEQLGYKVVTKRSSVQALELFRAEPDRFDLVITDMTMPHMTGDKLAQELMKIRPDIPVILCTGHSRLVSEEKAKEIGIKAFVMKPLVVRNLAETVRKVMDEK